MFLRFLVFVMAVLAGDSVNAAVVKRGVVDNGTSVGVAAKNTVGNQNCQNKYSACMDTFCMLDNDSGGRCLCSDGKAKYDAELSDIDNQNMRSYQLATFGADAAAMGTVPARATTKTPAAPASKARVDLSLWDTATDEDSDVDENADEYVGAELMSYADAICAERIPECGANDLTFARAMYSQSVRSDCVAYKNSIAVQRNAADDKLSAAQSAVRAAVLEKFQKSNKYNLSQCVVEFKKCMATTAECGDDFAACASVPNGRDMPMHRIDGAISGIEIYAATYEILDSKRIICEHVTQSCTNVAGAVWDTFLREVAPQIKSAELIAENSQRQGCVGSISECFRNACCDEFDGDESYDMCLTRPESMLSFCKVELDKCGVDAASSTVAVSHPIWDYVVARLASMRVNSCTEQVKECLTSPDRCGADYTQCVGLDTNTIMRMCPYEKLTGCQLQYGEKNIRDDAVYDELAYLVRGLMVNIDNSLMDYCQSAVDNAMVRACGATDSCNGVALSDNAGAGSLQYAICPYTYSDGGTFGVDYDNCRADIDSIPDTDLGRGTGAIKPYAGILDGTIYWAMIGANENGDITTADEYFENLGPENQMTPVQRERIANEINVVRAAVLNAFAAVESDPVVDFCVNGRVFQGLPAEFHNQTARFPNMTKSARIVLANGALKAARDNYFVKYDALNIQMATDYAKMAARIAEIAGENELDARRETARVSCIMMAETSAFPMSPEPPKMSKAGKGLLTALVVIAAAVASVFTFGAAAALGTAIAVTVGLTAGAVVGGAGGGIIAAVDANKSGNAVNTADGLALNTSGEYELNQWNFKQKVTTEFNNQTLICERCSVTTTCEDTKIPMFGKPSCKKWGEEKTNCTEFQF